MIWYLKEAGLRMTALQTQRQREKKGKGRDRERQRWMAAELLLQGTGGDQIETKDIYEERDKAKTSIDSDRQSALLAHGDSVRAEPLSSTQFDRLSPKHYIVYSGGGGGRDGGFWSYWNLLPNHHPDRKDDSLSCSCHNEGKVYEDQTAHVPQVECQLSNSLHWACLCPKLL